MTKELTQVESLHIPQPKRRAGIIWRAFNKHKFVYSFGIVLPLTLYAIFIGYPILNTIYLSFTQWNGLTPEMDFIGLDNYRMLFNDPAFKLSLTNNLKWAVITLLFPVVLGFLLAVFLHSGKVYFPTFFRSLLFVPVTMSLVTIGLMFSLMLNPSFGAINEALRAIGLEGLIREWLGDHKIALFTLTAVFGWSYTGMPMILYYAGISQISAELFEAAKIEGASGLQVLRYITIPMVKPVTIIVTMLTVIQSLRAFDLVMVMTQGGPFGTTTVLGYFMYKESFWNSRFGYGASTSVVILLLSSLFAIVYLRQVAGESLHAQ